MLYIDFIDTETGKQVFEEGKTIEAQQAIIDIKLRKFAIRNQSKDDFIQPLIQYVPEKKMEDTI
jgi:hypothetical protein